MGLVVLGVLALYFLLSIAVVAVVVRQARKRGHSAWRWGVLAALAMYLLVFWDHIPTVLMHRYYCEKEAGFWVYKTVGQWKKENPGVMETLVSNTGQKLETFGNANNFVDTITLNQRFVYKARHEGPLPLNRWRKEIEISDTGKNEVIAREVSFSTSQTRRHAGVSGWKFWLYKSVCAVENHRDQGSIEQIVGKVGGKKRTKGVSLD